MLIIINIIIIIINGNNYYCVLFCRQVVKDSKVKSRYHHLIANSFVEVIARKKLVLPIVILSITILSNSEFFLS